MSCSLDELDVNAKRELVRQIVDKKRGLSDIDWSELCEHFGLDINAETLRKAGVGIKLAADANMLGAGTADISDGYIERQKIRDLTRQINDMYRTQSRSELLREAVKEACSRLQPISVGRKERLWHTIDEARSLVVALGDFHYGANIHVVGLRGEVINHYDHTVFEERMAKLLDEVQDIVRKESIRDVHIYLVGDLIDGMLRQSQLMRLEYGIVESTIRLANFMAQWIAALTADTDVHLHAVTGNHSEVRPLKSRNREFEEENLEKIIWWFLKERLADRESVTFSGECGRMELSYVEGYSFLLLHGDGEKAIDQIARDAVNMYGEHVDFFICGHRHKEQEFPAGATDDGNSIIVRTPSICGTDKYAQSCGYGGKPGAIAMVIERGYGRRCVYPIQL